MKPRDIAKQIAPVVLGLLIRSVGLLFLYQFAMAATSLVTLLFVGQKSPATAPAFWGVIYNGALALWFISGAPPVAEVAYPRDEGEPTPSAVPLPPVVPATGPTASPAPGSTDGPKCVRCDRPIVREGVFCPYCGYEQPS